MTGLLDEDEIETEVPDALDIDAMTKEEYKEHVRKIALQVVANQGWCAEGAASTFKLLGLEPPPVPRSFTFRLPATATLELSFSATSLEEAQQRLTEYLNTYHATDPRRAAQDIVKYNTTVATIGDAAEYRDQHEGDGRTFKPIPSAEPPIDVNV